MSLRARHSVHGLPVLALLLVACGVGVPADKQLYVGQWDSENVSLRIGADGMVAYERHAQLGEVTIDGPIRLLTFRWDHPPVRDHRTGAMQDSMVVHSATTAGGPHWVSADLEDPEDLVAGDWTLRVLDGERVLTQRTFEVYVP